jgi:DUF1365 family protein
MHHRLAPKEHRFCHPVFMFCLDLDEIDRLSKTLTLFSRNRFNAYSFYDRDHLAPEGETAKNTLMTWLENEGVDVRGNDRIHLLTFPRVFGYTFNPVSFYFCMRESGEPVCAVAEVGNTFGEYKRFLVPLSEDGSSDLFVLSTLKEFYVSPFFDLDTRFEFRLRMPGERLAIQVDDHDGNHRVLATALTGRQRTLTNSCLAWFIIWYPLMTLKIILLIHWHALLLYLKRIPYIKKAARPEQQVDVIHPHQSLTQNRK